MHISYVALAPFLQRLICWFLSGLWLASFCVSNTWAQSQSPRDGKSESATSSPFRELATTINRTLASEANERVAYTEKELAKVVRSIDQMIEASYLRQPIKKQEKVISESNSTAQGARDKKSPQVIRLINRSDEVLNQVDVELGCQFEEKLEMLEQFQDSKKHQFQLSLLYSELARAIAVRAGGTDAGIGASERYDQKAIQLHRSLNATGYAADLLMVCIWQTRLTVNLLYLSQEDTVIAFTDFLLAFYNKTPRSLVPENEIVPPMVAEIIGHLSAQDVIDGVRESKLSKVHKDYVEAQIVKAHDQFQAREGE